MSLKYDRAKSILLGISGVTAKYQRDRSTKEQNSDKKGVGFEFSNGRQLALMNNPNETNIFIENVRCKLPQNFSFDPYPPTKTRSHALKTIAPRVRGFDKATGSPGMPAYYVTVNSETDLYKLLDWYQNIHSDDSIDPSSTRGTDGVRPMDLGSFFPEINMTSETEPFQSATTDEGSAGLNDADGGSGTGYEPDPKIRRIVEQHAVAKARIFYEMRGYSVIEKGKPYDLLCEKLGEVIHVEVKGSRNVLDAIIVTTNEVGDARNSDWKSDLFLVDSIVLEPDDALGYKPSGGRSRRAEAWSPEDEHLTPIQFRYKLPPVPDAE